MRIFAIILAVGVFIAGLSIVYTFYESQAVLVMSDPKRAAESYHELLQIITVLGALVAVFVPVALFLALTLRANAKSIATYLTRDITISRDRLQRFYELSPVPYLLTDRLTSVQRPNKAALRFFNTTEEGLIDVRLFDLFTHPEHPDKLEFYREQVKRSIPIEQKELQVRLANGEMRWVLFSAENLGEINTKDAQVLVTLVDIHEQKELERIKTEFLSLASHQLRAPLSNLKWYIDFLLKRRADKITPEVAEYLQKMYRRNEEMIDLVNTLLNLSRIEMGRVQVQKESTDVAAIAQSVVEELETAARDKQITIVGQIPPTCVRDTDGRLLRIVLQNLVTNAIRYTNAEGSVTLNLLCGEQTMRLEVKDTGVGIPPEEQGRIFGKMYRATNARSMEVNGNGIGLYMCKALSEALGGTISFESALGKGTTFIVDLPN